jgi:hypothetical protein
MPVVNTIGVDVLLIEDITPYEALWWNVLGLPSVQIRLCSSDTNNLSNGILPSGPSSLLPANFYPEFILS